MHFLGNPFFAGWNPVVLVLVAAILVEAVARTGAGLAPFFSPFRPGALERFGVGTLLGFGFLGTTFLGLALAGLFYPAVILGSVLLALVGAGAARSGPLLIGRAMVEGRRIGAPGLAAVALAALPAIQRCFLPETDQSGYIYHLGAPWSFLNAHRLLLSDVPWAFHIPITLEMTFALPLILGDERLAKWEVLACFGAVSAVFAGRCLREKRPVAAWMGPFITMSAGYVMWLLGSSKSDMAAASLFVAGALLTRGGAWKLGAIMLGFCCAFKLTYAPMAVVWLAVIHPPRALWAWVGAFLALPLLPWLAKAWLATGNPVYPLASSVFHAYDWGALNDSAGIKNIHNIMLASYRLADLPGLWIRNMRQDYLVMLLVVPGLLMASRHRRTVVACLLGQAVTFGIRTDARYLLPSVCYLSFLAAEEMGNGRDRFKRALLAILAGYGLFCAAVAASSSLSGWRDALVPGGDIARRSIPYQEGMIRRLGEMGYRRVIAVGETRTYRFPVRLLHGGTEGETPLVWKLVKESRDERELAKRFFQLGARHILYNHVGIEWFTMDYYVFPWDARMIRLCVEYYKRRLALVYQDETCDFTRGGYYIFEITRQPAKRPPGTIRVAPGMDSIYGKGQLDRLDGRYREALDLFLKPRGLMETAGDVGSTWNELGRVYSSMGDSANAYRCFSRFADAGMWNAFNLPLYGAAAVRIGRLDTGERVLQESIRRIGERLPMVYVNLAMIRAQRAAAEIRRGRRDEAEKLVAEGEGFIAQLPEEGVQSGLRRQVAEALAALRAGLDRRVGGK